MKRLVLIVCLASIVGGCSADNVFPDKRADYKKARSTRSLEVPPDLTEPGYDDTLAVPEISPSGTATYSDYSGEQRDGPQVAQGVLSEPETIRFERDGDRYWLVIQSAPAQVWPRLRQFWLDNGFLLRIDNPTIGIMETGWAENRADIPQGAIRSFFGKTLGSLYSAGTRDKFRVRLERGKKPETTELYLTHKGLEEIVQGEDIAPEGTIWKSRPRDPELEIEMLKRLMMFVGMPEQHAERVLANPKTKQTRRPRARMTRTDDGKISLVLEEGFSRAWRVTGLALDRVGFNVQDRDRARGIYYVKYQDPERRQRDKGFLSKLAFWNDDEEPNDNFQVFLSSDGANTRIEVRTQKGEEDTSSTGERILTLLHEELR